MYDDYFRNYGTQPTYQNGYDEYLRYENNYDRFMPRQVNSFPYANNVEYNNHMSNNTVESVKLYPEIYNKILPIIEKKLGLNISIMDNDTLERLTFEVYDEFTSSDIGKKLNVQMSSINANCSTCSSQNLKTENNKAANSTGSLNASLNNNFVNSRFSSSKISNQETNRYIQPPYSSNLTQNMNSRKTRSNCLLCDLIKIMILNNWKENQRPSKPKHRPQIMPNYFDVPYPEDFGY